MKKIFTQAFKIQAVEKVLNKTDNTTVKEVADLLGISISSLNRWTLQAKNHEFEAVSTEVIHNMTQDKRPQDWTLEERFNMVLSYIHLMMKP